MTATSPQVPRAAPHLERALLLTFVTHVLAMLGMVAFLLPGVPGGFNPTAAGRAAYVAGHPWFWRAGWMGWQLTAASDLYLSLAFVRTPWVPKRPAWFALIVTLLALLPDQIGQFAWSFLGPHRATLYLANDNTLGYVQMESHLFQAVGGWGACLYLIAAFGWTRCLYRVETWSKALGWLSLSTWTFFGIGVTLLCLPISMWTPLTLGLAGGLNAIAFVSLLAWIATAGEQVMRRARPIQPFGRHAVWRYPHLGLYGHVMTYFANSRFVRGLFEYVPVMAMASDIRDIIYVNYLVDAASVSRFVPPPLQLQTLGDADQHAVFTFLIYRHGHFGPRLFGPLRRLWRSPIQSNWRLYVRDPGTALDGVYFITTTISSVPYALAARLLSEGVPMHVPAAATLQRKADGGWTATLDPGLGNAPDIRLELHPTDDPFALPATWQGIFPTWTDALNYCVPQNRALTAQPWYGRTVRQEIDLDIPFASCLPLAGIVHSAAAKAIAGNATPICFYVPAVCFAFGGERYSS